MKRFGCLIIFWRTLWNRFFQDLRALMFLAAVAQTAISHIKISRPLLQHHLAPLFCCCIAILFSGVLLMNCIPGTGAESTAPGIGCSAEKVLVHRMELSRHVQVIWIHQPLGMAIGNIFWRCCKCVVTPKYMNFHEAMTEGFNPSLSHATDTAGGVWDKRSRISLTNRYETT